MSESRELSALAEQIIQYQKRHDQTDNELAFSSHVSVEHIHAIKAMKMTPPEDDVKRIQDYIKGK
ncbi:LBP_cg2779 family protein [Loigolactobacillus zhaoyuanensis]|uniref:LBP_cg2779 family protein n=1 Tax=Loigolactobacillus zhaoyuanensis TaxID=2486017 RepID=A0ABW8UHQ4_9LACO